MNISPIDKRLILILGLSLVTIVVALWSSGITKIYGLLAMGGAIIVASGLAWISKQLARLWVRVVRRYRIPPFANLMFLVGGFIPATVLIIHPRHTVITVAVGMSMFIMLIVIAVTAANELATRRKP